MKPALSRNPILVIDRFGLIGKSLSQKLAKEFLVVFVSQSNTGLDRENKNIIYVPFFKRFPVIPDNKYSHIIFVDEDCVDLELLPKIVNKIKNINADFIFVQGLSTEGMYLVDRVLELYPSAKVAILGDVFSDKLILKNDNFKSVINKFIYQAQRFGRIQVLGEGLRETYSVFLGDVVDELIDLVFGIYKSHSLFYIFPKHPTTELSLAHMIQKNNPEVTIDFVNHDPRLGNITFPPNGLSLLKDKYQLARKIRGVDAKRRSPVNGKRQDEILYKNIKKIKKFPSFIIYLLAFLLLTPLILTLLFSFLGINTLYYAKGEVDKGNFANAKSSFHLSQTFFYVEKQAVGILSFQARIIGQENSLNNLSRDLDLNYKISEGLSLVFNSEVYFSKVLSGESKNPTDDLTKGESYLKSSILALEKIKAEGKISAPIAQKLDVMNPLIKLLSSTADIMPGILGMEGQRTYLVLFQDNTELRPGGGFIGSYGILKLNMGKIAEFTIHDVYDADRQLRGHVEPPFGLRRYLPEQHWYMRDSNFDVDFSKSALSSSNLLLAESGQKADGVIAVDVSFAKSILHAVGSVYIADYGETVDEDNIYALTQSHADENFIPSAINKKDFLRSLYKTLVAKVTGEKSSNLLIAQSISDMLTQKHLMFSSSSDDQKIFTVNGWSSSLFDERKRSENSINDFIGINEANLGVNKVNYFIRRQISQKIIIEEDGNISEELVIGYGNESVGWPGGDYKNYLRVILPENTKLSEILINDKHQDIVDAITDPLIYEAKDFKFPKGLEVEKVTENGKSLFGFVVNIPAKEIVKIKLRYEYPGSISGLNNFFYNLKFFKQPGVDNVPYSFSLAYPNSFNIIKSFDGANKGEGNLSYSEKIVGDKNLIIDFAKK